MGRRPVVPMMAVSVLTMAVVLVFWHGPSARAVGAVRLAARTLTRSGGSTTPTRAPTASTTASAPTHTATAAPSPTPSPSPTGAPAGTPFSGVPDVGALFSVDGSGKLGSHYCTASVVDSPGRDLIITAAHCVGGGSRSGSIGLAFVPGFHDGQEPYGVWIATQFFDEPAWAADNDQNADVGFLVVSKPGSNQKIEDVTGAETLGIEQPTSGDARVIGYPASSDEPITCQNSITPFEGDQQIRFACPNYTGGTSGGPFLAGPGGNTVIGVIGGYQEGGDSPDVSYSITFGADVKSLYDTAVSA